MSIENVVMLLGGLALFLYGMQVMCRGLEVAAGDRLRSILEKLTSNRLLGVLVGAGITAIIQSSSATTVMVVGFVNSGLMTLTQAVGVIMGANVGTTVTGLLIALDIGLVAPLFAFLGVLITMMSKKQRVVCIGEIIAGLGILFIGMELMSNSMAPLREYEPFTRMMASFSNPLLGILAGALFTALVQSSSASIGILQGLAMSGVIGLDSAVYVLFGQNIGTCITAVLAGMGASRAAKRTTLIHLMFNCIGTAMFTLICYFTPFVSLMQGFVPGDVPGQIAATHIVFNIVTTIVLFPFGSLLAKAACKILPDAQDKAGSDVLVVDEHGMGATAISIKYLRSQLAEMYTLACQNVQTAFEALLQRDPAKLKLVAQREDQIDAYNANIIRRIGNASTHEMSASDSETLNRMLSLSSNIERIGDHAMNMAEYLQPLDKHRVQLDKTTAEELDCLRKLAAQALDSIQVDSEHTVDAQAVLESVAKLETESDDLSKDFRRAQIRRLRDGESDAELSILYSEMLTDVERMLDHTLNIAQAVYA